MKIKYPRTLHLPWSEGATSDDKILQDTTHFNGIDVVVTEKIDGENTTIYGDGTSHARSLDSKSHSSRDWLRQLVGKIAHNIPVGFRICGENVYACHSIFYNALPSYFLVFSIYDQDTCLSWDDTIAYAEMLELQTVPVIYRGSWDECKVKNCFTGKSVFGEEQEGYVVRTAQSFSSNNFAKNVAKMVRANHVITSSHWMNEEIKPNLLKN